MATSRRLSAANMRTLISLLAERRARISPSQDFERGLLATEEISRLSLCYLLNDYAPDGWFGRTSPVSCRQGEDGTLVPFLGRWANSGMGSPTEFLTLSTLEFHSGAAACSLSDILETGDVPQRYFLSATACRGILRRAAKRGKELPPQLARALRAAADSGPMPNATER